ncbi:MAG: D-alanine--D-alanine ligase [Deltaproteobacteria bacterium]|nr:D-alanine--D-alanine ligase [Deltaproteobacteria bacterium]
MKGRDKGKFRGKKIGVLMGGLSEEREISLLTGRAVLKALLGSGYNAVAIDAGRDVARRIMEENIEAAFIALHGRYGEDGCIQGLLEIMSIPYTGSGVMASSIAMDKAVAKKILACHNVPTPGFTVFGKGIKISGMKFPLVVKPASQGSAIGVTVVRNRGGLKGAVAEAERHGKAVLVEEFIEGRELTVAVLDGKALPVIEIRPKEVFYNYRAKYTKGMTEFIVPAKLSREVQKKVLNAALGAYNAIQCSGAARVDVMLGSGGRPYVLEVNTVPGMTELSLFPKAARKAGMGYPALVQAMLEGARTGKG